MNRRKFLELLGVGVASFAAAPLLKPLAPCQPPRPSVKASRGTIMVNGVVVGTFTDIHYDMFPTIEPVYVLGEFKPVHVRGRVSDLTYNS